MSQRPNHRRGEERHQDNGPRWENPTRWRGATRRTWPELGGSGRTFTGERTVGGHVRNWRCTMTIEELDAEAHKIAGSWGLNEDEAGDIRDLLRKVHGDGIEKGRVLHQLDEIKPGTRITVLVTADLEKMEREKEADGVDRAAKYLDRYCGQRFGESQVILLRKLAKEVRRGNG